MAFLILHFEEEGLVGDDVGVLQLLNVDEVVFEENDVFALYFEGFNCQKLPRLLAIALPHHSMRALSDLLCHRVVIVEKIVGLLFRLRLAGLLSNIFIGEGFGGARVFFGLFEYFGLDVESGLVDDGYCSEGVAYVLYSEVPLGCFIRLHGYNKITNACTLKALQLKHLSY